MCVGGGTGLVVTPAFHLFGCIAGIASALVTNCIPVAKIVDWFKKAKAIWGSVAGIWKVLRSGQFAAEMGTEAPKLIESLLGVGGIVNNCV